MKAKCGEIVIERYLKGDIGNEFKDGVCYAINKKSDDEEYLELIFETFKTHNKETLKILKSNVKVISKQRFAEVDEEFVGMLIKELEDEGSK